MTLWTRRLSPPLTNGEHSIHHPTRSRASVWSRRLTLCASCWPCTPWPAGPHASCFLSPCCYIFAIVLLSASLTFGRCDAMRTGAPLGLCSSSSLPPRTSCTCSNHKTGPAILFLSDPPRAGAMSAGSTTAVGSALVVSRASRNQLLQLRQTRPTPCPCVLVRSAMQPGQPQGPPPDDLMGGHANYAMVSGLVGGLGQASSWSARRGGFRGPL